MKRYRILAFDFDARPSILSTEIQDSWSSEAKELWHNNKDLIRNQFLAEVGSADGDVKIDNYIALGPAPFSILSFHNNFLRQLRNAFVIGAYYPALTSSCALGERILNHLILMLRDSYRNTPEYKKVYGKDSFNNWEFIIDILESWGVLLQEVVLMFRELKDIRHKSLHFRPEIDQNDRELALEAIKKLSEIISKQFGGFGPLPWIIKGTLGAAFIKKSYENTPFIEKVYLPCCRLVGYLHTLEPTNDGFVIHDDHDYGDRAISDEEFSDLYNHAHGH
jgi:hypothetical protein